MLKYLMIVLYFFFSVISIFSQSEITVMSYNIRYDASNDGENLWDIRKEKLSALMVYYNVDFIGTQEVQHHQLEYLLQKLPTHSYIGVARTDGKKNGEYSAILYNKERWKPIRQETFWLSPTPSVPSKGWDAAYERICTIGLFECKKTRKSIWVLNTHFDHVGKEARLNSAKMIVEKLKELNRIKNHTVIFMGDLNARPDENTIVLLNQHLKDAYQVSELPAYGPEDTWNAFQFSKKPSGRIDYIFIKEDPSVKVKRFATIDDFYDFKYPSDHLPVMAHIQID